MVDEKDSRIAALEAEVAQLKSALEAAQTQHTKDKKLLAEIIYEAKHEEDSFALITVSSETDASEIIDRDIMTWDRYSSGSYVIQQFCDQIEKHPNAKEIALNGFYLSSGTILMLSML